MGVTLLNSGSVHYSNSPRLSGEMLMVGHSLHLVGQRSPVSV